MTQNGKKFLEAISQKEELKEKFSKISNLKEAIAFAKENGFDLREEDLKTAEEGLMDDDDLDSVAGGLYSNGSSSILDGGFGDQAMCDCRMGGPNYHREDQCDCGIPDTTPSIKPDAW